MLTRLRVTELPMTSLSTLGASASSRHIIHSKGGHRSYVDMAGVWISGPEGTLLRRDLEKGHPWRQMLEILTEVNGNVNSGIGWHVRKMEVH